MAERVDDDFDALLDAAADPEQASGASYQGPIGLSDEARSAGFLTEGTSSLIREAVGARKRTEDEGTWRAALDAAADVSEERTKQPGYTGIFGNSWGMLTPSEQQRWLKDRRPELEDDLRLAKQVGESGRQSEETFRKHTPEGTPIHPWIAENRRMRDQASARLTKEAERELKTQVEMEQGKRSPAILTTGRGAVENVATGLSSIFSGLTKGVGIGAGFLGEKIGVDTAPDNNTLYALGRFIDARAKEIFPGDTSRQKEFSQQLAQGAGSMIGFYGPAIVGKLAGMSNGKLVLIAGGSGALVEGAETFDEATKARKQGFEVSEGARFLAYAGGLVLGTTEAAPISGLLNRTGGSRMRAAVAQAFEEATQEGFQTWGENAIRKVLYDPSQELGEGMWDTMKVGGTLGFGAGAAFRPGRRERLPDAPSAPTTQRPSPEATLDTAAPVSADVRPIAASQPGGPERLGKGQGQVKGARPSDPVTDAAEALLAEIRAESGAPVQAAPARGEATPPAPAAPTFAEVRAALPKDENGDPDAVALGIRIAQTGARGWNDLSEAQKIAIYQEYAPEAHAAAPGLARGGVSQNLAIGVAQTEIAAPDMPELASLQAPIQPASPSQISEAERSRFSATLASKSRRADWGKASGVSQAQLEALVSEAVADGRLILRKGEPVRTPKARQTAQAAPAAMERAAEVRLERIENPTAFKHASAILQASDRSAAIDKLAKDRKATRAVLDVIHEAVTGKPAKGLKRKADVIDALRSAQTAPATDAPAQEAAKPEQVVPSKSAENIKKFAGSVDALKKKLNVKTLPIKPNDDMSFSIARVESTALTLREQLDAVQRGSRLKIIGEHVTNFTSDAKSITDVVEQRQEVELEDATLEDLESYQSALSDLAQVIETKAQAGYALAEQVQELRDYVAEQMHDFSNQLSEIANEASEKDSALIEIESDVEIALEDFAQEIEDASAETDAPYQSPTIFQESDRALADFTPEDSSRDIVEAERGAGALVLSTMTARADALLEIDIETLDEAQLRSLQAEISTVRRELTALEDWANHISNVAYDKAQEAWNIIDAIHDDQVAPAVDSLDEARTTIADAMEEVDAYLSDAREIADGKFVTFEGKPMAISTARQQIDWTRAGIARKQERIADPTTNERMRGIYQEELAIHGKELAELEDAIAEYDRRNGTGPLLLDSYAVRRRNQIGDETVREHFDRLARVGVEPSSFERAIGRIEGDRRLSDEDKRQLAESFVGAEVEGDPIAAMRSAMAGRQFHAKLAEIRQQPIETMRSNLRVRDDIDRALLVAKLEKMAERLPQDAALVLRNRLSVNLANGPVSLLGVTATPQSAREAFGIDNITADRLLILALDHGPDVALRMFTHEEIHVLREMGILVGKDWKSLEGLTKRRPKKAEAEKVIRSIRAVEKIDDATFDRLMARAGTATWRELFEIDERYGALYANNEQRLVEETVAHIASYWADGRSINSTVDAIFQRIQDLLEALQNAIRGLGFRSANDMFESIWAGEVVRQHEARFAEHIAATRAARDAMRREGLITAAIYRGPGPSAVKIGSDVFTGMNHSDALERAAKKLGRSYDELADVVANAVDGEGWLIDGQYKTRQQVEGSLGPMTFAIAGENAQLADREALSRAKRMEQRGQSREDVWVKTGWYRGVDMKWRFEIDDSKATLRLNGPPSSMLPIEFTHDALFDNYPQMLDVEYNRTEGAGGSYRDYEGFAPPVMSIGRGAKSRKSVTLHEVQHGIQDVEGFAEGANLDSARSTSQYAEAIAAWEEAVLKPKDDWAPSLAEFQTPDTIAHEIYRRFAGEAESRLVQTRMKLSAEQRRARPPWLDYDVPEADQIVRMPDGSLIERKSIEEEDAFEGGDWQNDYFEELARTAHIVDEAVARRESRPVSQQSIPRTTLELEAEQLEKAVSDFERSLTGSVEDKAAAISDRFGFPVTGEDLQSGRVWWKVEPATKKKGFETFWTEPRLAELERVWSSMSFADLAKHMTETTGRRISASAINQTGQRWRARFPMRHADHATVWTPESLAEVKWGFNEGRSDQEIAARISARVGATVTPAMMRAKLKEISEANKQLVSDRWTQSIISDMQSDEMRGLTMQDLAKAVNDKYGTDFTRNAVIGKMRRVELRRQLDAIPDERPRTQGMSFALRDWGRGRMGPTPPTPVAKGQVPELNKIIAEMQKTLGMTVSQGLWGATIKIGRRYMRIRPASNVEGQYDRETGAVSVRESRDIRTIAHEGGHLVESLLGNELEVEKQKHAQELTGTATPSGARLSEAFAEWFKSYALDRAAAEKQAPKFTKAFDDLLEAERPDLLTGLATIESEYRRYIEAAPYDQMMTDVVTQYDNNTFDELRQDAMLDNTTGWISTGYTAAVDALHPLQRAVDYLLKVASINGIRDANGKTISLKTAEDPYKLMRMFAGAYNRGRSWQAYGVSDIVTGEIIGPSLKQAMETAFGGVRWDKAKYKSFSEYLISIRAVEEYNALERKELEIARLDGLLERIGEARPILAEKIARNASTIERRNAALTRAEARLSDRRRSLGTVQTTLRNIQLRGQELRTDLASDLPADVTARRRRSLQAIERDQRRLLGEAQRLTDEISEFGVETTILENEIDQFDRQLEKDRSRLADLDGIRDNVRKERKNAEARGAVKSPTIAPKKDHEDFIAKVEAAHPEFIEGARMAHEFAFSLLRVRHQAGFLTDEQFEELSKRKDWYVPFWRDLSDIPNASFAARQSKRWLGYKRYRGSDRAIMAPLEILNQEAYSLAQQIAFNDVVKALINLAERVGPGGNKIAERLQRTETLDPSEQTWDDLVNIAIGLGLDPVDAKLMVQKAEMNLADTDTVKVILSPEHFGPEGKPTLPLWENGERVLIRLPNPEFAQSVFQVIDAIGHHNQDLFTGFFAHTASVFRAGVTTSWSFIGANIVRDVWAAWKVTGATPVLTHVRGAKIMAGSGDVAGIPAADFQRLYNEAGGLAGGANVNAQTVQNMRDVRDLMKGKVKWKSVAGGAAVGGTLAAAGVGMLGGAAGLLLGGPIAAAAGSALAQSVGFGAGAAVGAWKGRHGGVFRFVEGSETAGRLGVAAHAYKRALAYDPTLTQAEAMLQAAFDTRDYLDWNRVGSRTLEVTRGIPFLVSYMNGITKNLQQGVAWGPRGSVIKRDLQIKTRTMLSDYLGVVEKDLAGDMLSEQEQQIKADTYMAYARLAGYTLIVLSLIAAGVYSYGGDDYDDIRDDVKAREDYLKINGQDVRIPVSFELAAPAKAAHILADYYSGRDDRVWRRLATVGQQLLAPPNVQTGINLIGGVVFNQRMDGWFSDPRPVVSPKLINLSPQMQYDAYTSQIAIDYANAMYDAGVPPALIMSPKKIDFLLTSYGGSWGRDAMAAYEDAKTAAGINERPARKAMDIPVVRRFMGDAARQSRAVNDFYRMINSHGGEFSVGASTYDRHMRTDKPVEADMWLKSLDKEQRVWALTQYHGSPWAKKSHPLARLDKALDANRDLMTDIINDEITPTMRQGRKKMKDFGREISIEPAHKTEINSILARLSQIEARNTMILLKRPGFTHMEIKDPQLVMDELKASSPEVHRLLLQRRAKEVAPWSAVESQWPRQRDRVLELGARAF